MFDPDPSFRPVRRRDGYFALGLLAVTDALVLRPGTDLSDDAPAGRRELIRSAVVLDGTVRVRVEIEPRGDASAQAAAGELSLDAFRRPDLQLHVRSNRPLESLRTVHALRAGERLDVALSRGDITLHAEMAPPELVEGWARDLRPLEEYDAGSQGP